ncbi:Hypothetical protein FKW44_015577, partial [Caligus rogercresseyi]
TSPSFFLVAGVRSDPFTSYTICNANLHSHNFELFVSPTSSSSAMTIKSGW